MTPLPNISTGNIRSDQRAFLAWYAANDGVLTLEQDGFAGNVIASFENLVNRKKDHPEFAKLEELHKRDVELLRVSLAGG